MMQDAYDLAERFQTALFFMSDLDLGMNNWMCDPFPYPTKDHDRGKVITTAEQFAAKGGAKEWGRYKDIDGDGIPWRTLPGLEVDGAAWFARGSGHNEYARYTESETVYENNVDRLLRKFETLRHAVPAPERMDCCAGGSKVGVIAYGTVHHSLLEARSRLKEQGFEFDYLRLRAFPFADSVEEFIASHDRVYVVEQNRDGQMLSLLRTEIPQVSAKLRSIRHYDGMPVPARAIVTGILAQEATA
jgi:2-oxoglutarate ferredoxin oxidoreductase subunit alpha